MQKSDKSQSFPKKTLGATPSPQTTSPDQEGKFRVTDKRFWVQEGEDATGKETLLPEAHLRGGTGETTC